MYLTTNPNTRAEPVTNHSRNWPADHRRSTESISALSALARLHRQRGQDRPACSRCRRRRPTNPTLFCLSRPADCAAPWHAESSDDLLMTSPLLGAGSRAVSRARPFAGTTRLPPPPPTPPRHSPIMLTLTPTDAHHFDWMIGTNLHGEQKTRSSIIRARLSNAVNDGIDP